jgi:hypothetical protein
VFWCLLYFAPVELVLKLLVWIAAVVSGSFSAHPTLPGDVVVSNSQGGQVCACLLLLTSDLRAARFHVFACGLPPSAPLERHSCFRIPADWVRQ